MAHGAAIQHLTEEFSLQVGACITRWADIEEELFEICVACLGCGPERAAIGYFRSNDGGGYAKSVPSGWSRAFPTMKPGLRFHRPRMSSTARNRLSRCRRC